MKEKKRKKEKKELPQERVLPNNSVFYRENKSVQNCSAQARILLSVKLTQSCFSNQCNNRIICLSSRRHFSSTLLYCQNAPAGHCPWRNTGFSPAQLCVMHYGNLQKQPQVQYFQVFFEQEVTSQKNLAPNSKTFRTSVPQKREICDNFRRKAILKLPTHW